MLLSPVFKCRAFCSFALLRFAFVEFGSPDDAASAYDSMQNQEIDGRQVFLDFASPGKIFKANKLSILLLVFMWQLPSCLLALAYLLEKWIMIILGAETSKFLLSD